MRLLACLILLTSVTSCNKNVGCTEFGSENYDSDAIVDDGSCIHFRDKFIGTFNANSDCFSDSYELVIQEATEDNLVAISNLSDTLNVVTARVYGDNITIDLQTIGTAIRIEGAGVYADTNAISLSYRIKDSRSGQEIQTNCVEWLSKIEQ